MAPNAATFFPIAFLLVGAAVNARRIGFEGPFIEVTEDDNRALYFVRPPVLPHAG